MGGGETEGSDGEKQGEGRGRIRGKGVGKKENAGIRENWMDKDGEIILWNI